MTEEEALRSAEALLERVVAKRLEAARAREVALRTGDAEQIGSASVALQQAWRTEGLLTEIVAELRQRVGNLQSTDTKWLPPGGIEKALLHAGTSRSQVIDAIAGWVAGSVPPSGRRLGCDDSATY